MGPAGLTASKIILPSSELSSDRDAYGEPACKWQLVRARDIPREEHVASISDLLALVADRTNPTGRTENMELFAAAAIELFQQTLVAKPGDKIDQGTVLPFDDDQRKTGGSRPIGDLG